MPLAAISRRFAHRGGTAPLRGRDVGEGRRRGHSIHFPHLHLPQVRLKTLRVLQLPQIVVLFGPLILTIFLQLFLALLWRDPTRDHQLVIHIGFWCQAECTAALMFAWAVWTSSAYRTTLVLNEEAARAKKEKKAREDQISAVEEEIEARQQGASGSASAAASAIVAPPTGMPPAGGYDESISPTWWLHLLQWALTIIYCISLFLAIELQFWTPDFSHNLTVDPEVWLKLSVRVVAGISLGVFSRTLRLSILSNFYGRPHEAHLHVQKFSKRWLHTSSFLVFLYLYLLVSDAQDQSSVPTTKHLTLDWKHLGLVCQGVNASYVARWCNLTAGAPFPQYTCDDNGFMNHYPSRYDACRASNRLPIYWAHYIATITLMYSVLGTELRFATLHNDAKSVGRFANLFSMCKSALMGLMFTSAAVSATVILAPQHQAPGGLVNQNSTDGSLPPGYGTLTNFIWVHDGYWFLLSFAPWIGLASLGLGSFVVNTTRRAFHSEGDDNMIFLSHDWGECKRNHRKVSKINKALQAETHLTTWMDEDQFDVYGSTDMVSQLSEGIDHAKIVLVFVTEAYMTKVKGEGKDGLHDNCMGEFNYAIKRRGPAKIIPVVLEAACRDTRTWHGPVGFYLSKALYYDLSEADISNLTGDEAFDNLVAQIKTRLNLDRRGSQQLAISKNSDRREAQQLDASQSHKASRPLQHGHAPRGVGFELNNATSLSKSGKEASEYIPSECASSV